MFLGIDLGTSSVKIVLMDEKQALIAVADKSLPISRPHPLWSEQNPKDWWEATEQAIAELRRNHESELQQVQCIGLSGQMHGAVLLGKDHEPLRPAILWNDGRSGRECQILLKRVPNALAITGNMIMPSFTAPKLLWVAQNEPEVFSKINKIILPKDYLRLKMSGIYATDMSDASGTSWLNVGKRSWSEEMIEASETKISQMPELFEGVQVTGCVIPEVAKRWGIPLKTLIVAGGGDNAASAVSLGATETGEAFLSLGTSGVYFVADNQFRPNPKDTLHTFCHCLPGRWHQMSVHLSAASCLEWLARVLDSQDIPGLIDKAKSHHPDHTPLFLPYLSGERTPHNNPHAQGAFVGLTHLSESAELIQAVLEGVAFAFREGQEVIHKAGVKIQSVSVIGGGARNTYWGEILASILQRPLIYRRQAAVGGAYGAARLAWYAIHKGDIKSVFPSPEIEHIINPVEAYPRLAKKQRLFAHCYQQLYPVFDAIHEE
jgi:xylulokinase